MPGPDSPNGYTIRHESEGWGFESTSGRDIICLKNFDTFTRTSVRVSKTMLLPGHTNISNVNFTSIICYFFNSMVHFLLRQT